MVSDKTSGVVQLILIVHGLASLQPPLITSSSVRHAASGTGVPSPYLVYLSVGN